MELDKQQLADKNGKNGNPGYVAVDGIIYDISDSKLWKNGTHMNRHHAGTDLSKELRAAPHGAEVLNKFQKVADLATSKDEDVRPPLPEWLNKIFDDYPFLKRHPHPMVVHFPMAFFITASLFLFWYYVVDPLEPLLHGILYLHILGTISLPFAMVTGWLSWKLNYLGKPISNVQRKIIFSFVVLIFDVIVLVVLANNLMILKSASGFNIMIPAIIFSYLPIVSFIGQQGGDLVY